MNMHSVYANEVGPSTRGLCRSRAKAPAVETERNEKTLAQMDSTVYKRIEVKDKIIFRFIELIRRSNQVDLMEIV